MNEEVILTFQAGISEHAAIFPVDSIKVSNKPDHPTPARADDIDTDASTPISEPDITPQPLVQRIWLRFSPSSPARIDDIFPTPSISIHDRRYKVLMARSR